MSSACREVATIHAVQLQAAHNYLLLPVCIGDGSLEDNSFDLVYFILVHLSRIFVLSLNNLDYV
jgi:hypothetical protein